MGDVNDAVVMVREGGKTCSQLEQEVAEVEVEAQAVVRQAVLLSAHEVRRICSLCLC